MKPLYRRILILVIVIVVLIGGYIGYRFLAARQSGNVPQDFSNARAQGGLISQNIVSNSNEIVFSIAHINDNASSYSEVSSTISDILGKVSDIRDQAIQLSGQLSIMTQALPNIRSAPAQEAALESISQRLALVSDLITYTDEVTQLANALRAHIESHAQNTADIKQLINEINAEVTAINNFNRIANESMDKFDSLLR